MVGEGYDFVYGVIEVVGFIGFGDVWCGFVEGGE